MVDYFALVVPHALMALACWRLLLRSELDREDPAVDAKGPGSAA